MTNAQPNIKQVARSRMIVDTTLRNFEQQYGDLDWRDLESQYGYGLNESTVCKCTFLWKEEFVARYLLKQSNRLYLLKYNLTRLDHLSRSNIHTHIHKRARFRTHLTSTNFSSQNTILLLSLPSRYTVNLTLSKRHNVHHANHQRPKRDHGSPNCRHF